jgi:DNA polymerase III delta subunit
MLYVLHGTNRKKVRERSHEILSTLALKRPDAQVFRLVDEGATPDRLRELLESKGLFEGKYIVVVEFALGDESFSGAVVQVAPALAESEHIFILLEEKLSTPLRKVLEEHATKVEVFDVPKGEEKKFNAFAIADACARRDKKSAWTLLQQSLREGMAPEEIHGIIWWQFKTLALVERGDTEGIKTFNVAKAQTALRKFSHEELHKLTHELVTLYHEARRDGPPLEIALEKWILAL